MHHTSWLDPTHMHEHADNTGRGPLGFGRLLQPVNHRAIVVIQAPGILDFGTRASRNSSRRELFHQVDQNRCLLDADAAFPPY